MVVPAVELVVEGAGKGHAHKVGSEQNGDNICRRAGGNMATPSSAHNTGALTGGGRGGGRRQVPQHFALSGGRQKSIGETGSPLPPAHAPSVLHTPPMSCTHTLCPAHTPSVLHTPPLSCTHTLCPAHALCPAHTPSVLHTHPVSAHTPSVLHTHPLSCTRPLCPAHTFFFLDMSPIIITSITSTEDW